MAFDLIEDVGVGLLLPFGEVVPVGDVLVGGFWFGDVLVDLGDPAQRHEAAFLLAAQFGGGAAGHLDEVGDLTADGARGLPFPFRSVIPRGNIARFGVPRVVLAYSGDPRFAEDAPVFVFPDVRSCLYVVSSESRLEQGYPAAERGRSGQFSARSGVSNQTAC